MKIKAIEIRKDKETQVIIGHAGFIKTAEDLYEAMSGAVPGIKFGVAFVEASGPCLVRSEGNDNELVSSAEKNAKAIGAGHTFIMLFKNAYPINVLNSIKSVSEVSSIYCATSNPVKVLVADLGDGAAVLGVVDGHKAKGIEGPADKSKRRKLLRDIGYKLG
ncbi:MAG: adenosine-specific kinase [Candidatus Micrarchaeaceae archaeon]